MNRLRDVSVPTLVEAVVLVTLVNILLRVRSVASTRWILRRVSRSTRPLWPTGGSSEDVVQHVALAGRMVPGENACLVRALSGAATLERRGHDVEFRIGVRHGNDGTVHGHAWLERPDGSVIGRNEDPSRFVPLRRQGIDV